jgi:hypothetical protein
MSDMSQPNLVISRDQARAIAEEYLQLPTTNLGGTRVRQVLHPDIDDFRHPAVYCVDLSSAWIAYVDLPLTGLRSSTIVGVCALTGRVLYAGFANDEG